VVLQSKQNPAAVALLATARKQTNNGQLRSAQTSLQRAQRIAPKDPEVYYSLADTHRRLGEFLQAEQVALKGVGIAQGQSTKLRRLWQLIASIRTDAGDLEGADKAAAVARRY
jgi:Flp pilus assembly protein TadD